MPDERPHPELETPVRALVVVPHPDDETLAMGGTLQRLHEAGCRTTIVLVTDGESSHPEQDPDRVRARRAAELTDALSELGDPAEVCRLGLPDAAVDRHEDELLRRLAALAAAAPGATVFAPHPEDVHRDHRACGRAARTIAEKGQNPLLHYAVWLWDRGDPASWRVDRTVASYLTSGQLSRKTRALACFGSQLGGVVPADVLERHSRGIELFEAAR